LIGFIEAESCFSFYKPSNSTSLVASFEITQTNGELLIKAIRNYLNLITVDKTNNFKIKVSSVRAIENIINFVQKAPIKLLGYKKLLYLL
jgi:LAGLIDADG endonuclease